MPPELIVTMHELHHRTAEIVTRCEAGEPVKVIDGRRCRCEPGHCTCPPRVRLVPGDDAAA